MMVGAISLGCAILWRWHWPLVSHQTSQIVSPGGTPATDESLPLNTQGVPSYLTYNITPWNGGNAPEPPLMPVNVPKAGSSSGYYLS